MSGTSTTTTQSNPKPYKPARGLIKQALSDASKAYQQGYGGQPYTGSTVIPFSRQTQQGMDDLMGVAGANMGGYGMSAPLQDILNNGGFTDTQTNTMRGLDQAQNSRVLNDTINGDGLNAYARNAIQNTMRDANGSFNLNANPAFQQVQQNALQKAAEGVNAQAAAAGRYGSGANQAVLGRTLGDIASNLAYTEYGNWDNKRTAANNSLAQQGNTALGNQFSALGQKSGLLSSLFNAQNMGIGNMGAGYETLQAPAKTAMGVGSMYEDLATRTMNDRLRVYDAQQNAPWDQTNRLMSIANLTGAYRPSTTVSTQPGPNPLLTALGGVSTGYGMLGSMGLFGGASAGGLGGMFG